MCCSPSETDSSPFRRRSRPLGSARVHKCIVHMVRDSFRLAGRQHRDVKALRPAYPRGGGEGLVCRIHRRMGAVVSSDRAALAAQRVEFAPFLKYDVEIRRDECNRVHRRPLPKGGEGLRAIPKMAVHVNGRQELFETQQDGLVNAGQGWAQGDQDLRYGRRQGPAGATTLFAPAYAGAGPERGSGWAKPKPHPFRSPPSPGVVHPIRSRSTESAADRRRFTEFPPRPSAPSTRQAGHTFWNCPWKVLPDSAFHSALLLSATLTPGRLRTHRSA